MIETILLNYLKSANLSAEIYAEQPKEKPKTFYLLEKTGGYEENHITESTFIIQSYAKSLYEAAELSKEIIAVMKNAITLDEIARVEIQGDYNYTDSATKQYRYQATFVVTHY